MIFKDDTKKIVSKHLRKVITIKGSPISEKNLVKVYKVTVHFDNYKFEETEDYNITEKLMKKLNKLKETQSTVLGSGRRYNLLINFYKKYKQYLTNEYIIAMDINMRTNISSGFIYVFKLPRKINENKFLRKIFEEVI